jgi:hypothetical protein
MLHIKLFLEKIIEQECKPRPCKVGPAACWGLNLILGYGNYYIGTRKDKKERK